MINSIELNAIVREWIDNFATQSMQAWVRYVKASGLSMPQFGILMDLHHRQTCGVTDIGDHMEISAAAASQLVDKLVQSGLLDRKEDPNDRRAKLITLSDMGLEMVKAGLTARSRWADELIAALEPAEYEIVAAAMQTLSKATSRLELKKEEKQINLRTGKTDEITIEE